MTLRLYSGLKLFVSHFRLINFDTLLVVIFIYFVELLRKIMKTICPWSIFIVSIHNSMRNSPQDYIVYCDSLSFPPFLFISCHLLLFTVVDALFLQPCLMNQMLFVHFLIAACTNKANYQIMTKHSCNTPIRAHSVDTPLSVLLCLILWCYGWWQ